MIFGWRRPSKIPCYVLVFDQLSIIEKSLEFLTRFGDRLELVVIENPSRQSPAIGQLIDRYGRQGLVKRYYRFDANITGMAYDIVITQELPHIKRSPYVMITDGDLTASGSAWLEEELSILKKNPDVFACGVSLDMSNLPLKAFPEASSWIPPDRAEYPDFYEATTGGHLLLMRGQGLYEFMGWKEQTGLHFLDGSMHRYCYEVLGAKWARTKRNTAYHLTWDLYQDKKHRYTKLKTAKTFDETWRHRESAPYTLTEY